MLIGGIRMIYEYNKIMEEVKKLKMPKEYFLIDLKAFFEHDYYMMLSIRKDAGKTTQSLLLGLILNKLYGIVTEYMRSDETQIRKGQIETMYDVIRNCGYIGKIFNYEYNDITYRPMTKKWYLCYVDNDGKVEKVSPECVCAIHSLENSQNYKSGYNSVKSDYIIFDEFMDTTRQTYTQMNELCDNISTFGRDRENVRVMLLGNNTNKYCHWFEEFTIVDQIEQLNFGGSFSMKTELGTTFYGQLMEVSEAKKETIKNKHIRFYGFNTPKMNAFNGLSAWRGDNHRHITDIEDLKPEYERFKRFYIHHRGKYVQVKLFCNDKYGYYCFCHFSNGPAFHDNIILSVDPLDKWEIYGYGQYCDIAKTKKIIYDILALRTQHKWFYASNSVGDLIADYVKEARV